MSRPAGWGLSWDPTAAPSEACACGCGREVAVERPEDEECQRGTVGCSIWHEPTDEQGCETW